MAFYGVYVTQVLPSGKPDQWFVEELEAASAEEAVAIIADGYGLDPRACVAVLCSGENNV